MLRVHWATSVTAWRLYLYLTLAICNNIRKMKSSLISILNFINQDFSLSRRQVFITVIVLLTIGFGLRCGYGMMRERPPRDEKFYIKTVAKIVNNDASWTDNYELAPMMPILAASIAKFGVDPETALHTLNMTYSMLWILIMFFLVYEVFDNKKIALLGMILAVFNPYSIRISSQILREPLYILIFTISLWITVKYIKDRGINPFFPLLLAGLTIVGFFSRYEGIEIGLLLPVAIFVICMQYKWKYIKRCVCSLAIYVFAVGLIVGTLISFNNSYMCNVSQKTGEYFKLVTGKNLK